MVCQKCGKEVRPGTAFCGNCGNPIQVTLDPPPDLQSPSQNDGKKPRKKLLWLVPIILAAILVLILTLVCPHWNRSPATCTEPETCQRCGKIFGDSLGHDWAPATCNAPETCTRCGVTRGTTTEHTPGNWETQKVDIIAGTQTKVCSCAVCRKSLESKEEPLTSLHDASKFLFTPKEYAQRFQNALDDSLALWGMDNSEGLFAITLDKNQTAFCSYNIYSMSKYLGHVTFSQNGTLLRPDQIENAMIDEITFVMDDEYGVMFSLMAALPACHPSMTIKDVDHLGNSIFYDLSNGGYTQDGLSYHLLVADYYQMHITID